MDLVESITSSWTVFEHLKGIKRWKKEDLEWINMSQDSLRESLIMIIGRDKALKLIANSRIALRKNQEQVESNDKS